MLSSPRPNAVLVLLGDQPRVEPAVIRALIDQPADPARPVIVARHADHWNVWGGPQVLARKGKILDEHCAAVGRDPGTIARSVNMALLITDKKDEVEQLAKMIETRMGRHAADARDTCLAGTPDQIRERLQQLKAAGCGVLFIPSMFRPLPDLRRDLDRFITEIAPAFR
jgi:alkanesulfonate monooxygenase SsuD/methylene tetrahydromethanopterin reductase-like flavin-dependent oxidoreductase (luciferase family)